MPPPRLPRRSLTWRLLPWLVPIALILVGLVFVTASLSGSDEPTQVDAAPANVRAVVTDNAEAWAVGQVGAEVTTKIESVVMVGAAATGASTFAARAVIVRLDSSALAEAAAAETGATVAEADRSTVATCVLWNVDVSAKTADARGAIEVQRETGHHELADAATLRDQCDTVQFPG